MTWKAYFHNIRTNSHSAVRFYKEKFSNTVRPYSKL
uniref:Uncharacterized protein n=1 Tax=Rhizophora mucronata TaxID=61149 RepID=A0A2P2QW58_RHIMU